jgi:hypothetical protein
VSFLHRIPFRAHPLREEPLPAPVANGLPGARLAPAQNACAAFYTSFVTDRGEERRGWFVLVYKLPAEPTHLRASVWRRLKAAGSAVLACREDLEAFAASVYGAADRGSASPASSGP